MERFDKTDLLGKVKATFFNNRADRSFITEITKKLKNRIPSGKIIDIINENHISIDNKELYWLSTVLEELKNKFEYDYPVNTLNYFTEIEVGEAENYIIQQGYDNTEQNTIVLNNVVKIEEDEYVVPDITMGEIVDAWKKGVTTYNYDTQREGVIIDTGMGNIRQPFINKDTVKEIAEAIINGKFHGNMITWNILHTRKEKFDYNEEKKQLVFYKEKGSDINTIDGFHRTLAFDEAIRLKPEIKNKKVQLKIYNYDVERALEFISQEAKGNPLTEERKKSANKDNYTKIVDYLNNSSKSKLQYKVSLIEDEVYKLNTKYVLFSTLHDSIKDWFIDLKDIKFQSQFNNTARQIEEVLNYIITYYEHDFANIKASQNDKRPFTENNMFIGYIWLAYKLMDEDNWDEKLNEFLKALDINGINFNVSSKQRSKKYRNIVYNYFRDVWELI